MCVWRWGGGWLVCTWCSWVTNACYKLAPIILNSKVNLQTTDLVSSFSTLRNCSNLCFFIATHYNTAAIWLRSWVMFVHFLTCVQNPIMDICKNGTHLLPRDNLSHCVQRRCSTWKKEGICCLRNKLKMQVYFASSWVYWTNPIDVTDHLCCFQKHLHRMNNVWGNVI